MAYAFGQFMTHDIALTWHEGGTSGCKGKCFESGTDCYGIPINANDRVFNEGHQLHSDETRYKVQADSSQ